MGKRIIQQRRGRGTSTYRVSKKVFKYKVGFPKDVDGEWVVVKLISSRAHSAPIAKLANLEGSFYIPAFKNMYERQKISFGKEIAYIGDLPIKTKVYCIESKPGDGGKFMKSAGNHATINKRIKDQVFVLFPSKKEKGLHPNCRALIGISAGHGRMDKPIIKAGKQFYIKKVKNKLWPRTSAIKMNVIDHPFGSGRGKNPKSKIAKRNAPPGKRVGLIRPKRTGKRK